MLAGTNDAVAAAAAVKTTPRLTSRRAVIRMASNSCRSELARDMIDEGRGCSDVDQDRREVVSSDPRETVEPDSSGGLSTAEAERRLRQFGPNAVVEERVSLPKRVLRHFWAPVPWMLEATIALQLAIGQHLTALLIALLLLLERRAWRDSGKPSGCGVGAAQAAAVAAVARQARRRVGRFAGRRTRSR